MSNHCKPNKYNHSKSLLAVFAILLGMACAFAADRGYPSGKPRIALLGDSMTWIGGDSCQNETGWSHTLRASGIASSIDVYARSGATWTNTANTKRNPKHYTELLNDDNVVFNQAVRLIERADTCDATPDIIVLFAGANDAWFAAKRPGMYEKDMKGSKYTISTDPTRVTTLEGSIHLVCDILQQRFPDATLLFVTPLQMSKSDAETIFRVSDIIEKAAADKECMTLRADKETGITHNQEKKSPRYTYDGVHTNPEGAKILGDYIVRHITRWWTDN